MDLSQILEAVAPAQLTAASTLLGTGGQCRHMNTFNPDPIAGFDEPTVKITDPTFGTATAAGIKGQWHHIPTMLLSISFVVAR